MRTITVRGRAELSREPDIAELVCTVRGEDLEYGAASVREISETLGFATVSHFIGQFKKNYGVSPLVYRKNAVRRPPESGK